MFSAGQDKNAKDLLKEQMSLGARLIRTIPAGSSIEDARGFVTVMSSGNESPVLTFCVEKAGNSARSILTTLVFNNPEDFSSFVDGLLLDLHSNFELSPLITEN